MISAGESFGSAVFFSFSMNTGIESEQISAARCFFFLLLAQQAAKPARDGCSAGGAAAAQLDHKMSPDVCTCMVGTCEPGYDLWAEDFAD